MRRINLIVIHCSATPPTMDIGAATIRRWHTDPPPKGRGWKDIGYHYVIRRGGLTEIGRDVDHDGNTLEEVGAHVAYANAHSVGICMVGGVNAANKPENNFTQRQWDSLIATLLELVAKYPKVRICGHHDLDAGKACPSFKVSDWLKTVPSLKAYA